MIDLKNLTPEQTKNLERLVLYVEEHMASVEEHGDTDSDDEHYIFEAAMEFVFGPDVWKRYNAAL